MGLDREQGVDGLIDLLRAAGGYLTWEELRVCLGRSVFQDKEERTKVLDELAETGRVTVTEGRRIELAD